MDGLRAFVKKCPRNMEIFYTWLARWAEKSIKQSLDVGNVVDASGVAQALLIKVIHVNGDDSGNGNGNGNGDGHEA
jgi:hypothetical protein